MLNHTEEHSSQSKTTLGKHLEAIRKDRKLTQRQVEEATNKEVSNAYLSQIENDQIKQPSPHVLHTLAELYKSSYEHLMELAGYVVSSGDREPDERHGRLATFSELNLSPDEESELLDYLDYIRSKKKPRDKS